MTSVYDNYPDDYIEIKFYEGVKITMYLSEVRPELFSLSVSGRGLEDSEYTLASREESLKRAQELIDEYLKNDATNAANEYDDDDEF
jgi:hypothetical protein